MITSSRAKINRRKEMGWVKASIALGWEQRLVKKVATPPPKVSRDEIIAARLRNQAMFDRHSTPYRIGEWVGTKLRQLIVMGLVLFALYLLLSWK